MNIKIETSNKDFDINKLQQIIEMYSDEYFVLAFKEIINNVFSYNFEENKSYKIVIIISIVNQKNIDEHVSKSINEYELRSPIRKTKDEINRNNYNKLLLVKIRDNGKKITKKDLNEINLVLQGSRKNKEDDPDPGSKNYGGMGLNIVKQNTDVFYPVKYVKSIKMNQSIIGKYL